MVAIRNCKFLLAVTGWADSEGNERSSRSCKIDVFGIGCQGKPSAGGGRPPLRLGRPSGKGNPLEDLKVLMRSVKTGFEPFCHFIAEKFVYLLYSIKRFNNRGELL